MDRFARNVAVIAGISLIFSGLWALFAPSSFFDNVATFPPYNEHLIHDIGAFLTGIGAVLIAAVAVPDGLLPALSGSAVGLVLHGIAHFVDSDLGGRSSDPYVLTLLGLIVAAAAVGRAKARAPRDGA